MTKDDIIRMAREAGFYGSEILGDHEYDVVGLVSDLERFAALVASAEREACAEIAFNAKTYLEAAAAIRARGQYD